MTKLKKIENIIAVEEARIEIDRTIAEQIEKTVTNGRGYIVNSEIRNEPESDFDLQIHLGGLESKTTKDLFKKMEIVEKISRLKKLKSYYENSGKINSIKFPEQIEFLLDAYQLGFISGFHATSPFESYNETFDEKFSNVKYKKEELPNLTNLSHLFDQKKKFDFILDKDLPKYKSNNNNNKKNKMYIGKDGRDYSTFEELERADKAWKERFFEKKTFAEDPFFDEYKLRFEKKKK